MSSFSLSASVIAFNRDCTLLFISAISIALFSHFLKNSNCAPSLEYIQQNCSGFIFSLLVEHKGENFTISTRIYDTLSLEDVKYLYYVEKTPDEQYKVRAVFK